METVSHMLRRQHITNTCLCIWHGCAGMSKDDVIEMPARLICGLEPDAVNPQRTPGRKFYKPVQALLELMAMRDYSPVSG